LGASRALRERIGIPAPPVERAGLERCLHALEQTLEPDQLARALNEGELLEAAQAVELALQG
jgi:hypothetical protein